MLVLLAQALAAPPLPQVAGEGFAVSLAASASQTVDDLVDTECADGGNCSARRARGGWGGTLALQVTPLLGAWLHVGTETVQVAQAEFTGEGFGADGGVLLNLRAKQEVGAMVWLGGLYGYAESGGTNNGRRWGIRPGGAARFGQPDQEFVSWVGAELAITGADDLVLLDRELTVPLAAPVPVSVVAGFTLLGASLRGPGTESPRLFLATDGSIGAETAIRVSLGSSF